MSSCEMRRGEVRQRRRRTRREAAPGGLQPRKQEPHSDARNQEPHSDVGNYFTYIHCASWNCQTVTVPPKLNSLDFRERGPTASVKVPLPQ